MNTYCYAPNKQVEPIDKINLTFGVNIRPVIGGGTTDYDKLKNRPSINGVVLTGNKTNEDIKIHALTNEEIESLLKSFV